jgi:hypothetical protein
MRRSSSARAVACVLPASRRPTTLQSPRPQRRCSSSGRLHRQCASMSTVREPVPKSGLPVHLKRVQPAARSQPAHLVNCLTALMIARRRHHHRQRLARPACRVHGRERCGAGPHQQGAAFVLRLAIMIRGACSRLCWGSRRGYWRCTSTSRQPSRTQHTPAVRLQVALSAAEPGIGLPGALPSGLCRPAGLRSTPPPPHPTPWPWPAPPPQAMDGTMNLEQALEERLRIINCTPQDIKAFICAHPPATRMAPVRRPPPSTAGAAPPAPRWHAPRGLPRHRRGALHSARARAGPPQLAAVPAPCSGASRAGAPAPHRRPPHRRASRRSSGRCRRAASRCTSSRAASGGRPSPPAALQRPPVACLLGACNLLARAAADLPVDIVLPRVHAPPSLPASPAAAFAHRELTLPIAQHLRIPKENVYANRMNWQVGPGMGVRAAYGWGWGWGWGWGMGLDGGSRCRRRGLGPLLPDQ